MSNLHSKKAGEVRHSIGQIPFVASLGGLDWARIEKIMPTGLRLPLGQSWLTQPEPEFSNGEAWLGLEGAHLCFYAKLQDDRPSNAAVRRNEMACELGDVVELFLQREDRADYYEFHVTPENQRLQLHFPKTGALQSGLPVKSWMVEEDLFESSTRIDPSQTSWEAFLRVDLAALLGVPPFTLHFLIGRYDYQPGRSKPVISSAGQIPICDFHRLDAWSTAEVSRNP
jgi:hypothetical protein